MTNLIPINVQCHSGYKADEYPKCFYLDNNRIEIEEIIDRWYQGDSNPEWPVSDYFKVEDTAGNQYLIKHDLEVDIWYLCP